MINQFCNWLTTKRIDPLQFYKGEGVGGDIFPNLYFLHISEIKWFEVFWNKIYIFVLSLFYV